MNDIINLNSIRSDSCDCNKPKPTNTSCGCHNHNQQPCHQAINLSDQYFKVKNLFSELKSEWQRTEARSNLGIVDILGLEQTVESQESGGTNEWTMTTSKGGVKSIYKFYVKNGQKGETGDKGETGAKGDKGDSGKSAFELADERYFYFTGKHYENIDEWLNSLKGRDGEKGEKGDPGQDGQDGQSGDTIASVQLISPAGATQPADAYIWQITLNSGKSYTLWVPKGGSGESPSYSTATFLYKKVHYNTRPSEDDLAETLIALKNEVNSNGVGKSISVLTNQLGWTLEPDVIRQNDFIFMAQSITTDTSTSKWAVVRLTGLAGEKGDKGDKGDPGTPGGNSQGLIGPTIRLMGQWVPGNCYYNQSLDDNSTLELRFIDIVLYKGLYYMVRPEVGEVCSDDSPAEDTEHWEEASQTDFAYINTLIADYLNVFTVDSEEIRIHNRIPENGIPKDIIVAGMTGGESLDGEVNDTNRDRDPIRIWAGSSINTLSSLDNSYTLNIADAPFRVHQSGKLEATNADIEGIVQANTLRLGKLQEINNQLQGTFLAPKVNDAITLPRLVNDRVQLFYLLTNQVSNKSEIIVNAQGTDLIQESDKTTTSSSFVAKYEKLYILFGMDVGENNEHTLIWFVIEQDMKAASSIIPGVSNLAVYGSDYTGGLNVTITPNDFYDNKLRFNIQLTLTINNLTNYPLSILVPFMQFSRQIKSEYGANKSMEGCITVHFTQMFLTFLPNKTTTVIAALEDNGDLPTMSQGGNLTTIQYQTLLNDFTEQDSTEQENIINGTWSDTTPNVTFDGFTADSNVNHAISLDYQMPGIIIVNRQAGQNSTQLNLSNTLLQNSINFYQNLGITITDNELEPINNN